MHQTLQIWEAESNPKYRP